MMARYFTIVVLKAEVLVSAQITFSFAGSGTTGKIIYGIIQHYHDINFVHSIANINIKTDVTIIWRVTRTFVQLIMKYRNNFTILRFISRICVLKVVKVDYWGQWADSKFATINSFFRGKLLIIIKFELLSLVVSHVSGHKLFYRELKSSAIPPRTKINLCTISDSTHDKFLIDQKLPFHHMKNGSAETQWD